MRKVAGSLMAGGGAFPRMSLRAGGPQGQTVGVWLPFHWIALCRSLSHVWLFATPWTVARQAPLFMRFSRQEYWSGLPFTLTLNSLYPQVWFPFGASIFPQQFPLTYPFWTLSLASMGSFLHFLWPWPQTAFKTPWQMPWVLILAPHGQLHVFPTHWKDNGFPN